MLYAIAFSPWVLYAVIPAVWWQWSMLAALAISVAIFVSAVARRRPVAAMIIEIGSMVFFAAGTILALADPDTALHPYLPAISALWVGLIAWFSLLVRNPFTLGIAKLNQPPEVWRQPLFVRTNVIITAVWAICFTVGAVLLAACAAGGAGRGLVIVVQVAHFVVPMVFTFHYVAVIRKRVARMRAAAPTPPVYSGQYTGSR
ncbi:hypothetical protein AB0I55_20115 [Actinocatenispora sera]|uniref:hypothetical protein n=1 Tax=Actinocatenispora sera TaxID=390989 RepID=UPI003405BE6A